MVSSGHIFVDNVTTWSLVRLHNKNPLYIGLARGVFALGSGQPLTLRGL